MASSEKKKDPTCTVRVKPVRPNLTQDDVLKEVNTMFMTSYPKDASSAFQDLDCHVVDLYFETPVKASNSIFYLNNREIFGHIVQASVLQSRPSILPGFQPQKVVPNVPMTHTVRLTPIKPTRSKDEVMQEAKKRLMFLYYPRDVSSASKDPQSDQFVADLYFETPEKAKNSLFFLNGNKFFDQIVTAKVVEPKPKQPLILPSPSLLIPKQPLIHPSPSLLIPKQPAKPPLVSPCIKFIVVVEPVQSCSIEALQLEASTILSILDVQYASKNLHLQQGLLDCEDSSNLHPHLSPCAYFHFQDRERAQNAAEFLSRAGVMKGQRVRGILKDYLDCKGSIEAYISPYLTSGWSLRQHDEAAYFQSGVLLYRSKGKWGEFEALFSLSSSRYSFVQGKRRGGENTKDTALRVLKEETNIDLHVLEKNNYIGMEVMWFGKGSNTQEANCALYLINVYLEELPYATEFSYNKRVFVWLPLSLVAKGSVGWPRKLLQSLPQKLIKWAADLVQNQMNFTSFYNQISSELQGAKAEKPNVIKLIEAHNNPIPKFTPTLSNDLEYLSSDHKEYKNIEKFARHPIMQIKKVNVLSRKERFESYVNSLNILDKEVIPVFHGTKRVEDANNIARNGPNISLAGTANAKRLGCGFYTAATPEVPSIYYATNKGALCVCKAALGQMEYDVKSDPNLNQKQLEARGKHSVVEGDWHVLFHPDAIWVEYIIDYGDDDTTKAREVEAERVAARKHHMAEKERSQKKLEHQMQLTMIEYFCKQCQATLKHLENMKPENLALCMNIFKIECQQFQNKLPIYAYKENFLQNLEQSQGIVLKGGTGIGKSVLVPQWVYDHYFCPTGYSHLKVAVLVPRCAIAEGLATYISQSRGCEVGGEIGLGIDGNVKMSSESRIVFMTYGFFKAISIHDKYFIKWGAIILDEAHERKTDADSTLARLGAACKARPKNFKAIVMSATIEGSVFVDALTKGGIPKSCIPIIIVPGVTFPVEDIWWDGEPWNPRQNNAISTLALATIRIYNKEQTGNLLVFLSTIDKVIKMTSEVRELLKHDTMVNVCSLYASMPDAEKRAVTCFDSNSGGKRMICISTNIAEAGITIAGISVVIDTGWEMEVVYDPVTKLTTSQQIRISKASQIQRRGRAGRTRPGTCYYMYSREEFEKFPEYNMPEILKTNLESFTLGMFAVGFDPFSMDILDKDKVEDRLECAKQHLLKLHAITQVNDGKFMITDRGKMLSRLPMELNLGLSILAASDNRLHCSAPVAIVACMFQMAAGGLFTNDKLHRKEKYKHQFGDHLTYLVVYEAWVKEGKSQKWCCDYGINYDLLIAADNLLSKVHVGMIDFKIPLLNPLPKDRTHVVLRAICGGLCHQTAIPFNTKTMDDGFLLTQDYDKNPTVVHLHQMSTLVKSDAPTSQLIVFQSRTQCTDGRDLLLGVSVVDRNWVEEAMLHDKIGLQAFKKTLMNMERKTESIPISFQQDAQTQGEKNAQRKIQLTAFVNNYKELKLEFTTVCFKFDASLGNELLVCFPRNLRQKVVARIQECVGAVQPESGEMDLSNVKDKNLGPLLENLQKDVQDHLGSFCTIERIGTKCKITTFRICLDAILATARSRLGLPSLSPSLPILGSIDKERMRAIQCGTHAGIVNRFGKGMEGSLVLLAWAVLQESPLWIYGGFIRDIVIRGDAHDQVDLDLGAPPNGDLKGLMQIVTMLAERYGMHFKTKTAQRDPKVEASFFRTIDDTKQFEVQVVDAHAFALQNPRIDFDVNNLKLGPRAKSAGEIKLKVDVEGMTVENVLENIRNHRLVVHKPATEVSSRIDKMRKRGWRITYAAIE